VAGSLLVRPRAGLFGNDGYVLLFWFDRDVERGVGMLFRALQGPVDFAPVVFCYFLIRLALTI
jgi:hypothetical protein